MRHIQKGPEPASLTAARRAWAPTPGTDCDLYDRHLAKATKDEMLTALLDEQQRVCAYTGLIASEATAHIEHLIPRGTSCHKDLGSRKRPLQTIAWNNLVACIPHNPSGHPYGAGKKDKWPSEAQIGEFVTPLDPQCEVVFRYGKNGNVTATDGKDGPGTKTIQKIKLDHGYLTQDRKKAIEADLKTKGDENKRKLVRELEDRTLKQAPRFAFQRAQVLRREWGGIV